MDDFTEFVARLKAWKIFIPLVLPMLATQFLLMSGMPSSASLQQPPSIEEFEALLKQTMLMSLLMVVLLLVWLLSISFAANRRVTKDLRPNTRLAGACAVYAPGYIALAPYIWPVPGDSSSGGESMAIVIPFHLLAMLALFYVLAFAARNMTMAERQSAVSFFDYAGAFFLMWFFPIGVWFIQPRVNRLVSSE